MTMVADKPGPNPQKRSPRPARRIFDVGAGRNLSKCNDILFLFRRPPCFSQRLSGHSDRRHTSRATELKKPGYIESLPTTTPSSMSLRFPRPQSLLGALPYQPFKRGVLRPALLRTQNASRLEQTQLTCSQARRFKSTTTHAGNIVQDPKTGGLPTAAGIEVRPCWLRSNGPLTPAVASQIGDSPKRGTEDTPSGLKTSVWGKLREFLATERLITVILTS